MSLEYLVSAVSRLKAENEGLRAENDQLADVALSAKSRLVKMEVVLMKCRDYLELESSAQAIELTKSIDREIGPELPTVDPEDYM